MDVYIARQPIFDNNKSVFGYELLYRDGDKNFFDMTVASNIATSIVLMNSYLSFGIDNLVENARAFINFEQKLIKFDVPLLLDRNKIVVELLEDIVPDKVFMDKIRQLKAKGYTIAMDDYVEGYTFDDLVELADIIKVDFFGNTQEQIKSICTRWKSRGKLLLAEKVETGEVFQWARSVGFDYYQGYFFSKPIMMKSKKLEDSAFRYAELLEELNREEPDNKRIAKIVETDATMTYKLLKLVNSKFTLVANVSSIKHALAILGVASFKKWLSLALMQQLSLDKPSELLKLSLIRAKFLEQLGEQSNLRRYTNELMLIGLLSVIDAMLEKPMEEVLLDLPLAQIIKDTLNKKDTLLLHAYNMALDYERGSFSPAAEYCDRINFDCSKLPTLYYNAIKWSIDLFDFMQEEKQQAVPAE